MLTLLSQIHKYQKGYLITFRRLDGRWSGIRSRNSVLAVFLPFSNFKEHYKCIAYTFIYERIHCRKNIPTNKPTFVSSRLSHESRRRVVAAAAAAAVVVVVGGGGGGGGGGGNGTDSAPSAVTRVT